MKKVKCSKYPEEKCFYCESKILKPCVWCRHNLYQDIRFIDKLEDCFKPDYELPYKKLIIFAELSAGKDTFADYLVENYGFIKKKLGKKIRFEVDNYVNILNIPKEKSRELYVKYGQMMRQTFSEYIWCEELYKDVNSERIIIADGRQNNELDYFLERGFTPIGLVASEDIRKERVVKRDGYNQINEDRKNDETEVQARENLRRIKEMGGIVIENNGTLESLYARIDEIMMGD